MAKESKSTKSVCDTCAASPACGTLKQAMVILDAEARMAHDSYSHQLVHDFFAKIKSYGFGYDDSSKLCWLSDKRSYVQDLTVEAIALIREVQARRRGTDGAGDEAELVHPEEGAGAA